MYGRTLEPIHNTALGTNTCVALNSYISLNEIITTAMVEAMADLFPEVPVEVEANICNSWAEK